MEGRLEEIKGAQVFHARLVARRHAAEEAAQAEVAAGDMLLEVMGWTRSKTSKLDLSWSHTARDDSVTRDQALRESCLALCLLGLVERE